MEHYYSYVIGTQAPENQYQLVFKNYVNSKSGIRQKVKGEGRDFNNYLVDDCFLSTLWRCPIVDLVKLLDYHFQKFTGAKEDFMVYTEHLIKSRLKEQENQKKVYNSTLYDSIYSENELRGEVAFKWIEKNLSAKSGLSRNEKAYSNSIWFKVGLSFATGEMNVLLKKYGKNATRIANEHFKNPSCRPYISEGLSAKPTQTDKCIYQDGKKMRLIVNYCKENSIAVTEDFINRIPSE